MAYIAGVWEMPRINREDPTKGETMLKELIRRRIHYATAALLALQVAGCGVANPILSSGPSPRVEDCMLLQQATPTKYVCGGKTYTAVQLTDIRTGKSAAAN